MGFLSGKRILITGVLSTRSIAYGIARACHREGASIALTYQNERFEERIRTIANEFGCTLTIPCDVTHDDQIDALFATLTQEWGHCDGVVHAMAYAPRDAIGGNFLEGCTRDNFRIAHDISAYSLVALARGAMPLMKDRAGALLTLSYLGAARAVPNYNTMGLAKASLEATVRYIAQSVGPLGVRCNGISAGPIKTLAASGIEGFSKILKHVEQESPLRRNVTIDDVGNAAAFLLSDLAAGITGEITYVDNGYSISAAGLGAPVDGAE